MKAKLEKLFVYYCDYSIEKGDIFIKVSNLGKMLKDARVLVEDNSHILDIKKLQVLASKETGNPS